MSLRKLLSVLVAALVLPATSARADTIMLGDMLPCVGSAVCNTPGGGTVTAVGGVLSSQTLAGWTGIGVSGGAVEGEIDGQQSIEVAFGTPQIVSHLELVFLYEPPAYNDVENPPDTDESARIGAFDSAGGLLGLILVNVTGALTATTTGGSIANLSIATEAGGGAWMLQNPFGSALVARLVYTSADPGPTSAYSDFAIGSINAVPEPGTLLMLGLGLTALARRRKQR